ncbi:uncharacterized protein B0H18DRAFT_876712, partial [Fomitopsis serialis]|uniref:uncharacterized protein n=1 Tax=Fomitopsis serialis TaxID=139415 RepID=UPI00200841A2
ARKCRGPVKGVRRYQDSKDKSSTSNLKTHAIGCWGQAAVEDALSGKEPRKRENAINIAFAKAAGLPGPRLVQVSHRNHTNTELMSAGRPNIEIPSPKTISRDLKASFQRCQSRVKKMLTDHPGRIHFATDAWTSPNHRAFVAWTAHLEFQGAPLSFLLDIIEVPEVRHWMIERVLNFR